MFQFKIREKITGLLVIYFLMALAAIGSTLAVSWQMEGAAAAVNDAGRERMRSYRIAFLLTQYVAQPSTALAADITQEVRLFENTLLELEHGNPQRPLFLPDDPIIKTQMAGVQRTWQATIKPMVRGILDAPGSELQARLLTATRPAMENFVADINALVGRAEYNNAQATALLRSIQIVLIVIAFLGTILLDFIISLLLVRPVQKLNAGLQRMGGADFDVRLPVTSRDELGELAQGFNQMAEKLQDLYATLEQRVEEKTRSIEAKNRELSTLYDIAASLNASRATTPLCEHVLDRVMTLIGTPSGVIRLTDPKGEHLHVVAARGVSKAFLKEEACLSVGTCICGEVARDGIALSADLTLPSPRPLLQACNRDGFRGVAAIPIRSNQRQLGMLNLFFDTVRILPPSEVRLLESVGLHLGIAVENQRLVAREREMAVSEERNLLAQELHDSIAQSLAFLNIQVQLLHQDLSQKKVADAMQVLEQIREGVQESYDDVRELLVHFRTRLSHTDLQSAITGALDKFEGQVGVPVRFSQHGPIPDVPPEHLLQVLHILQESLSNIRKHAAASQVDVTLKTEGECRLSIRDNGRGFDLARDAGDAHVGIRIMRERAHRFGGRLTIESAPGTGTQITLSWSRTPLTVEPHPTA